MRSSRAVRVATPAPTPISHPSGGRTASGGWRRWPTAPRRPSCVSSAGTTRPAAGTAGRSRWRAAIPRASVDALIGLAADALGVGRFAASARRAAAGPGVCSTAGRLGWRSGWPGCRPNWRWRPATARRPSATPSARCELAAALGSARHSVKSDVVLAAALCSDGRLDRSRAVADAALETTQRLGLVPLSWALACLLGEIGSGNALRRRSRWNSRRVR